VPRPLIVDMTAAKQELGYRPVTTYEDAVGETVDWIVRELEGRDGRVAFPEFASYLSRGLDYAAEDALLAELGSCT
jgi:hypothetical protein